MEMVPDQTSTPPGKGSPRILIVDANQDFLDALLSDPTAADPLPLVANTGKKAQLFVADEAEAISSIFVNPTVGTEATLSLIRFTHLMRPMVWIFIMSDKEPSVSPLPPFQEDEIKRLGVKQLLKLTK